MTVNELRARVKAIPVTMHHMGQLDRITAWIDWELLPDGGADGEAPRAVWDDDGVLLLCAGDTVSLHFGCRRGGKWAAFGPRPAPPPPAAEPSNESEGEVSAGDGVPLVV